MLGYDKERNTLYYPYATGKLVYPFRVHVEQGGAYYAACSGRYPMSLLAVRAYMNNVDNELSPEAKELYEKAENVQQDIADRVLTKCLEGEYRVPPYAHQEEAIETMLHYDRLAVVFEQGLGKTFISIMTLVALKRVGKPHKALVICPNIVFPGWLAEIAKYSDLKALPYKGNPEQRKNCREAIQASDDWDCVVTTFDMLSDKTTTNEFVYEEIWAKLGDRQTAYADRWLAAKYITDTDYAVLTKPKATKKWKSDCAKVLKKVPVHAMNLNTFLETSSENSNTEFFKNLGFDVLIVDEASKCLDPTTTRSQLVKTLALKAQRAYLLSGTLCVGRPIDLYMPMQILGDDIFNMNWASFKNMFCIFDARNKHIIRKYKNVDKLKLLASPHFIARTRDEAIDLPDRIITQRYYEPTFEMVELYNDVAQNDLVVVNKNIVNTKIAAVKISKCLQILSGFIYYDERYKLCNSCKLHKSCDNKDIIPGTQHCIHPDKDKDFERKVYSFRGNPKLQLLSEDLDECVTEKKIIIWGWYQEDLKAICGLLDKKKISYVRADEEDCATKFESSDDIRVFVGQTVQGIGITLNSATCMIYYSHGMALEPRLQSMDRNYRIGQTQKVIVKDYICSSSVEELVVRLLNYKKDVKAFMQDNVLCMECPNIYKCAKDNTQYGSIDCIYHDEVRKAEEKQTIKLPILGC
ncbi:MAG: DEAD/DEAH box helicase [Lachnospiraceae bacterium]|nr:DEAD/DEAH box helicase [Lachnospiraceae bacterium]